VYAGGPTSYFPHQYYYKCHGFLLAYSISRRSSFDELGACKEQILRAKDTDSVPMVLVGSFCDLESKREVSTREGEDLARAWGVPFFETSAKTGVNVQECFFQLVREIRNPRENLRALAAKKLGGRDVSRLWKGMHFRLPFHCLISYSCGTLRATSTRYSGKQESGFYTQF